MSTLFATKVGDKTIREDGQWIEGFWALGCAVALLLGAPSAQAQGTVKIGLIMTYCRGSSPMPASRCDNGVKTYMKQHGDTVAGKKIEIIRKDVRRHRRPTSPSGWRRNWSCATRSTSWPASC